ncbi:4873_t:CDS:1, partial [Acaulospora morrowiae]
CCLSCLVGTLSGNIIGYILGGIDFYVFFYELQNDVNPISLLLFWTDLWTILFAVYTTIEAYIGGEVQEKELEFDLENYLSNN